MKYCYNSKWIKEYENLENTNFESKDDLKFDFLDNGIVLPCKQIYKNEEAGGLIDRFGNFRTETEIRGYFGDKYDYDKNTLQYSDETIFLIPIIYKQWGHFLVDNISWLWSLSLYKSYGYTKIGYTGRYYQDGIQGNYLEVLNLLGIKQDDLIYINEPTQFKRVYFSERAFGVWDNYHVEYKKIIESIVDAAITQASNMNLPIYNNIYFTRRNLPNTSEFGEKPIEETFRMNGFKVLAPEKLSVIEQIWYINNAESVASLSGSVSLNAMFLSKNGKWIILNRMSTPNIVQYKINALFNVKNDFVDCYDKFFIDNPLAYGPAQSLVCITKEFKKYLRINNMQLCQDSIINQYFRKLFYNIKTKKLGKSINQNKTACKDSYKKGNKTKKRIHKASKTNCQYIKFGHYPQNSGINNPSPIEWQILSIEQNKALCVSKYALDFKKYNETCEVADWERCTLRHWLNQDFLNMAFNSEEQQRIVATDNAVDKHSKCNIKDDVVQDKVFLLSTHETEKYFNSNQARKCIATEYALSNCLSENYKCQIKRKTNRWWLMSPGYRNYNSAFVHENGHIDYYGFYNCIGNFAVRPALWITLE